MNDLYVMDIVSDEEFGKPTSGDALVANDRTFGILPPGQAEYSFTAGSAHDVRQRVPSTNMDNCERVVPRPETHELNSIQNNEFSFGINEPDGGPLTEAGMQIMRNLPSRRTARAGRNNSSRRRNGRSLPGIAEGQLARDEEPELNVTLFTNRAANNALFEDIPSRRRQRHIAPALASHNRHVTFRQESRRLMGIQRARGPQQVQEVPFGNRLQWAMSVKWKVAKAGFKDCVYQLGLWRSSLKTIEGRFGTGVVSYFIFLRWLLLLDVLLVLQQVLFIFLPQVIDGQKTTTSVLREKADDNKWYSRIQATISGGGYLEDTELFYGTYTNATFKSGYEMPYAYLMTNMVVFLSSLLVIVYSMSKVYRKNYSEGTSGTYSYCNKTFGAWDFTVTDHVAAKEKSISIKRDFEEEIQHEKLWLEKWDFNRYIHAYFRRLLVNLIVVIMLAGAGLCIYLATTVALDAREERFNVTESKRELTYKESASLFMRELAASLTVSAFDLIFPSFFHVLAFKEMFRTPRTELQATLLRTILLRLSSLGVLMVSILVEIDKCRTDSTSSACRHPCWETFTGQEIYQLVIVDFFVVVIATVFGETIWSVSYKRSKLVGKVLGPPEFFIAKNVLELLYAQALLWLGAYFSPLLPLICVIKLFIFFYIKKLSLLANLNPSSRPYRAAKSSNSFRILLLITLFLCLIPIGYCIVEITPSVTCGPFRGRTHMYDIIPEKIDKAPVGLRDGLKFIGSAGFLGPLFVVMLMIIYYFYAIIRAQKAYVLLLQEQLKLEGKDKNFLLRTLQDIQQKSQVEIGDSSTA